MIFSHPPPFLHDVILFTVFFFWGRPLSSLNLSNPLNPFNPLNPLIPLNPLNSLNLLIP